MAIALDWIIAHERVVESKLQNSRAKRERGHHGRHDSVTKFNPYKRAIMQSLAILHTIELPLDPQMGPIFRSVYSTVLKDGRHVRGTGYDGLIAALRLLQDEHEDELAKAHEDEQRLLIDAKLQQIRAFLDDYVVKHELLAASAEETQRRVAQFYLARTKIRQGSLAIQTRFIGSGSGSTTMFLNGEEIWHATTPFELLAMVTAHYGSEGDVPVP